MMARPFYATKNEKTLLTSVHLALEFSMDGALKKATWLADRVLAPIRMGLAVRVLEADFEEIVKLVQPRNYNKFLDQRCELVVVPRGPPHHNQRLTATRGQLCCRDCCSSACCVLSFFFNNLCRSDIFHCSSCTLVLDGRIPQLMQETWRLCVQPFRSSPAQKFCYPSRRD